MKKVYYEAQKEYLSFGRRLRMVGKILVVLAFVYQEVLLCGHIYHGVGFFSRAALQDPVDSWGNFLVLGGCLCYCVHEAHYVLWGYRPRKFASLYATMHPTRLLAEHASAFVHITEVPPEERGAGCDNTYASQVQPNQGEYNGSCVSLGDQEDVPVSSQMCQPVCSSFRQMLRFVFTFFGRCTIALQKLSGSLKPIAFTRRCSALLAYIALMIQDKALKIRDEIAMREAVKEELLHVFYENCCNGLLDNDKSHIKKITNHLIQEEIGVNTEIGIFKRRKGNSGFTERLLSEYCQIELPSILPFWYDAVQKAQEPGPDEHIILLGDLRNAYAPVIEAYQTGLLEADLYEDSQSHEHVWDWARDLFFSYRQKHLAFLAYAAKRECAAYEQEDDPVEQHACLKRAAMLYREGAYTCATFSPEVEQGEVLMRQYLHMCQLLQDFSEVRVVCNTYWERMRRYDSAWEPNPRTIRLLRGFIQ